MKNPDDCGRMCRRDFVRTTAAVGFVLVTAPYVSLGATFPDKPVTRALGRTGFEVTTLGLGGQASIQWTPPEENPEKIILKALSLGITYFMDQSSHRYRVTAVDASGMRADSEDLILPATG
jgi:hypothetical protein